MADVTADINQTRAVRIAQRRIEGFAQQFGEAHCNLARHAAFPLVLTPDLLYQIWANFVPEAPWTAVAHVLLSRLCRQVGYEMYEMDISDRNLLLRELKEQFEQERFDDLGEFLLDYVAQRLTDDDTDTRDLREAQEWTALVYTKPIEAARELAQRLSERMQQEDTYEVLRVASLVESYTEPLLKSGFEPLLIYTNGIKNYVNQNYEVATEKLNNLFVDIEYIEIAGINLTPPPELNLSRQQKFTIDKKQGNHLEVEELAALRKIQDEHSTIGEVINIDWQTVSHEILSGQQRLTTNPLTSGEGITYRTEQVYVPLGLVERKKQPRISQDVSLEQSSELYREMEITQRFEHQQFLEQILRDRQSPKSQGKRIAIIGESGSGKTTFLQQIAQWVSQEIEQSIVIWVSLADLRSRDLESYLLEVWLQAAARRCGQAQASTQIKDDFVAQFNQGLVWLFLDGVDEMQEIVSNPLGEIERQFRTETLLQQSRIVLSCRLNLWDSSSNSLDSFDNYRIIEFSYPQQVEQFINNWFSPLASVKTQTGQKLCAALRESGNERIRDLVKNPLRLTLLCSNWYLSGGDLPKTKAGLYEQFVADFYEWKKDVFATTAEQRRQLNAALVELAQAAFEQEVTKFRLSQQFVCKYLGEPDNPDSLFELALRLGLLNKVGVDGENYRQGVYGFFHPAFQEYFASLAISQKELGYQPIYELWGEATYGELINVQDNLSSEQGIDYTHLRDLLANGSLGEADEETLKLMVRAAKREEEGWLDAESIKNFPCTDLQTIDQLWVNYSNGRFGFSVQKRIWESMGAKPNADDEKWLEFGKRVGWRGNHGAWQEYKNINFSENAPLGHLPLAKLGGGRWTNDIAAQRIIIWGSFIKWVSSLALRLGECGL